MVEEERQRQPARRELPGIRSILAAWRSKKLSTRRWRNRHSPILLLPKGFRSVAKHRPLKRTKELRPWARSPKQTKEPGAPDPYPSNNPRTPPAPGTDPALFVSTDRRPMSVTDYFSLSRNNAVIGSAAGINAEGVRKLSLGVCRT